MVAISKIAARAASMGWMQTTEQAGQAMVPAQAMVVRSTNTSGH
jgi:hypothetical protein